MLKKFLKIGDKFSILQSSNKVKPIVIYIQSEGDPSAKITIQTDEMGEVLAKILKKNRIPLPFECGFDCSCATCAVRFQDFQQFESFNNHQPPMVDERVIVNCGQIEGRVRLSCQIKVSEELDGVTLLI